MVLKTTLRPFGSDSGRFASWVILVALSAAFCAVVIDFNLKGIGFVTLFALAPLFVISASDGMEVDAHTRMYRDTVNFWFFFSVGKWKPLPQIERISVIASTVAVYAGDGIANSINSSKRVYVLRLHPAAPKKMILVGRYKKQAEANKEAERLSLGLSVPATTLS